MSTRACVLARGAKIFAVHVEMREAKAGQAALPGAEEITFAAQPQILLGDAESVVGLAQDGKPRVGCFAERALVQEEAGRAFGAAADAAAQLMELREAEALGVLDTSRLLRHVDSDLDHGGGDEDARLA